MFDTYLMNYEVLLQWCHEDVHVIFDSQGAK